MNKLIYASGAALLLGYAGIFVTPLVTAPAEKNSTISSSRPATFRTIGLENVLRAEVEEAIEHFRRAMVERKPDWIIADSMPNLTFGHSNGVVQTREEFAEVVRSGEEIFERVELTGRHLTISNDVAVERHHFSADILYHGKLMNFELEVTEIWQRSDRWRLLARQAVKV